MEFMEVEMFYRTLGNSGLKISSIGLGTMNFGRKGWGCSEEEGHIK